MRGEDATDKVLDKVHSLYASFDDLSKYIKDYCNKYEITESYSDKILTFENNNSFKSILLDLTTKNPESTNNLINNYNDKIITIRKFILSEIAHTKAKDIDFQITNPFFFQKLRKEYRKLISELDKLDEEGITQVEDIDKFNLKFENIIERLRNLEYEIEDEKKSGSFNIIGKIAVWGIPIIIGIYQLVAMNYFIVDPYLPLIFYAVILCLAYLLLKSIDGLKLLLLSFKFEKTKYFTYMGIIPFILFIIILIINISVSSHTKAPAINDTVLSLDIVSMSDDKLISFVAYVVGTLSFGLLAIVSKENIGTVKKELIEKVNKDLAKKYRLWNDWT